MICRSYAAWTLNLFLICATTLQAGDFAIRTRTGDQGQATAMSENLTVFQGGKIYDFQLTHPHSVSVFDVERRQFLLALPDEGIQTTVGADELVRFAADEQTKASSSKNELVRFSANPRFKEEFDAASGRLRLSSAVWDYEVETTPSQDPAFSRQYSEFANWFTYLNAMFSPLPPAIRLELNQVLDRHQRLPRQVSVRVKRPGKRDVERQSRHELIMSLGAGETQPITTWQSQQPSLRYVDFASYRKKQVELQATAASD